MKNVTLVAIMSAMVQSALLVVLSYEVLSRPQFCRENRMFDLLVAGVLCALFDLGPLQLYRIYVRRRRTAPRPVKHPELIDPQYRQDADDECPGEESDEGYD